MNKKKFLPLVLILTLLGGCASGYKENYALYMQAKMADMQMKYDQSQQPLVHIIIGGEQREDATPELVRDYPLTYGTQQRVEVKVREPSSSAQVQSSIAPPVDNTARNTSMVLGFLERLSLGVLGYKERTSNIAGTYDLIRDMQRDPIIVDPTIVNPEVIQVEQPIPYPVPDQIWDHIPIIIREPDPVE